MDRASRDQDLQTVSGAVCQTVWLEGVSEMESFFVAGSAEDPTFAEAEQLGEFLIKSLPRICFTKDMRHPSEWPEFRKKLTRLHGFACPGSAAVVWRRDGRLVGSTTDFKRVLKDMYNLELECDPDLIGSITSENKGQMIKAAEDSTWTPCVPDGTTFQGGLKGGKFHGHGRHLFPSGAKFVGMFAEGKREGSGRYKDAEGNIYDGNYSRGLCHGKGKRTWPSGREYVGNWAENEATGRGVETMLVRIKIEHLSAPDQGEDEPDEPPESKYEDGKRMYTGMFTKGRYHGDGFMEYENGDVYDGQWVNGLREGPGIFTWTGKEMSFDGVFENDMPKTGLLRFDSKITTAFPGEIKLSKEDMPQWNQGFRQLALEEGGWLHTAKEREAVSDMYDDFPIHEAHSSAMAKALDRAIWSNSHHRITSGGITVHPCIAPGLDPKQTAHPSGLMACDPDCYTVFSELFNEVIRSQHEGFDPLTSVQPVDVDETDSWQKIQSLSPAAIDLATGWKLSIDRNVGSFSCAKLIREDARRRVEEVVVGALLKLEDDELKGEYFPLEKSVSWAEKSGGMSSAEADQLRAHGALFEETDCSDTRNWPDARGVFMSNNKKLFVHINKEEHVSFFCVGTSGEGAIHFQEMFKHICKALSSSEASIFDEEQQMYGRSDNLGFLLSSLDKIGTGMTVQLIVKVPKLTKRQQIDFMSNHTGLTFTNIHIPAEGKKVPLQDLFALSVPQLLGSSESDILNRLIEGTNELAKHEKTLAAGRKKLWLLEERPKVLIIGANESLADDVSHATRLAKEYHLGLVTSQEAVQLEIDKDSKLGRTAKWYLDAGKPVPREVVRDAMMDLLKDKEGLSHQVRIAGAGAPSGWVCSGFPASPEEVEMLMAAEIKPNKIISLKPDAVVEQAVVARRLGRRRDKYERRIFYLQDEPANQTAQKDSNFEKLSEDRGNLVAEATTAYTAGYDKLVKVLGKLGPVEVVLSGEMEVQAKQMSLHISTAGTTATMTTVRGAEPMPAGAPAKTTAMANGDHIYE